MRKRLRERQQVTNEQQFYCAGGWRSSTRTLEVRNPHDDSLVGTTSFATHQDLDDAIAAAEDAFEITRYMPAYERTAALTKLATLMEQRQDDIATLISRESGKPLRDARVETARGVFTVQIAAEEARRMGGET